MHRPERLESRLFPPEEEEDKEEACDAAGVTRLRGPLWNTQRHGTRRGALHSPLGTLHSSSCGATSCQRSGNNLGSIRDGQNTRDFTPVRAPLAMPRTP